MAAAPGGAVDGTVTQWAALLLGVGFGLGLVLIVAGARRTERPPNPGMASRVRPGPISRGL